MRLAACLLFTMLSFQAFAHIIGIDERVPMKSESMPWSAIGAVQVNGENSCTATLVARNIILTTAQCLLDKENNPLYKSQEVSFLPNYKEGQTFHKSSVIHAWFGTQNPELEPWKDWALAQLTSPLGDLYGVVKLSPKLSHQFLENYGPQVVTLSAYSDDFYQGQTAGVHVGCSLREMIKFASKKDPYMLGHDCDIATGTSGGPLLYFVESSAVIVGVATSFSPEERDDINIAVELKQAHQKLQDLTSQTMNNYRQGR